MCISVSEKHIAFICKAEDEDNTVILNYGKFAADDMAC
jgi:hypothetical protein